MERRMGPTRDLIDKKVDTLGQKPQEDWRKNGLYNFSSERHHPENTSEAAQERTSSSSDRNIEPDVDIALLNRGQTGRRRRWEVNRSDRGVTSEPGDSPKYWQGSRAESGPDDGTSNTSEFGE